MTRLTKEMVRWRTSGGQIGLYVTYYSDGTKYGNAGIVPPDGAEEITEEALVDLLIVMLRLEFEATDERDKGRAKERKARAAERIKDRKALVDAGVPKAVAERMLPDLPIEAPRPFDANDKRKMVDGVAMMHRLSVTSVRRLEAELGL